MIDLTTTFKEATQQLRAGFREMARRTRAMHQHVEMTPAFIEARSVRRYKAKIRQEQEMARAYLADLIREWEKEVGL